MNRTAWLQDRRMEKFCDVLSRWKARELSAQEAGEILLPRRSISVRFTPVSGIDWRSKALPGRANCGH